MLKKPLPLSFFLIKYQIFIKMQPDFDLKQYGITDRIIIRNASPAELYKLAVLFEKSAAISDKGALMLESGTKTGRSPRDKRIIERPESVNDPKLKTLETRCREQNAPKFQKIQRRHRFHDFNLFNQ